MQSTENWKPIPGYEGYMAGDHGHVYSIRAGRVLKPFFDTSGYHRVSVYGSSTRSDERVHRLILAAFVGPCPEGMEGCHDDGTRTNNHLSNLRWDTRGANALDKARHGTDHERAKTACPQGHALVAPNLVAYLAKKGQRGCLSCARGRAWAHGHGVPFTKEKSDEYYARLHL